MIRQGCGCIVRGQMEVWLLIYFGISMMDDQLHKQLEKDGNLLEKLVVF